MTTAWQAAILAKNPVGYWPLDDDAGAVFARDLSGNGLHATKIGAVIFGAATNPLNGGSTSARFTGGAPASAYLNIAGGGGSNPYDTLELGPERSVEFCAKILGPSGAGDGDLNMIYRWRYQGYSLYVTNAGNWGAFSRTHHIAGGTPTDWHHVFARESASRNVSELWIDRVLVSSGPYPGHLTYLAGGGIVIGEDGVFDGTEGGDDTVNGHVTDVAIYDAFVGLFGAGWQVGRVGIA
jgi:hypothetical protein